MRCEDWEDVLPRRDRNCVITVRVRFRFLAVDDMDGDVRKALVRVQIVNVPERAPSLLSESAATDQKEYRPS